MSSKKLIGETKKIFLYSIVIYLVLSIIYLTISVFVHINTNDVLGKEIISSEERLVDVEKTIISNRVNRLISDILYISDSLSLSEESTSDLTQIEKQWLAFSDRKKIYDQIRFIDLEGNEVIRINYSENGSYVTKKEDLQNKKNRYYVSDTMDLERNQIYISKLDLNVENNEIEQPIKPMVRLSTKQYGSDGELKGIVVLNYSADDMLEQVETVASSSRGNIFMLNSNGYWIYNGENKDKEWAFMYEYKGDVSFQNEFPSEWNTLKSKDKGSDITSNGIFSYTNVVSHNEFSSLNSSDSIVMGEGDWYIVSYINKEGKEGVVFDSSLIKNIVYAIENNVFPLFMIFIIAFIFALLIIINNLEKKEILYYSEYDAMTGVYNRRAGFEKLKKAYKETLRDGGKISVCFIDVNGLKEVNDNLGHDAGDELILSIVYGIKDSVRNSDIITRLGGDEFLIIFNDLNGAESEKIWMRINEEYKKINETQNRKYVISASHGIEEFKFNSNEYIDAIINSADEKMYVEKRIIKKDLEIIRK